MSSPVEREVDQILGPWWQATHQTKRRLWVVIPIGIACFLGGLRWAFGFWIVMYILLAWLVTPTVRILLQRRKRPLVIVLWLRRFHRGSQSTRLLRFWEGVVAPWGQIITLSDEDVRRPRSMVLLVIALCVLVPPLGALLFSIGIAKAHFLSIYVVSSFIAFFYGGVFLLFHEKRAVTKLRSLSQVDDVFRHLRRMHSEKFMIWSGGSGTIQCPPGNDEVWRAVISKLAPEVGAVIVDYGGTSSTNIDWEVETLQRVCVPGKMILAVPEAAATSAETAPAEIDPGIQRLWGTMPVPQVITYPHRPPFLTLTKRYEAVTRIPQRILGVVARSETGRLEDLLARSGLCSPR